MTLNLCEYEGWEWKLGEMGERLIYVVWRIIDSGTVIKFITLRIISVLYY